MTDTDIEEIKNFNECINSNGDKNLPGYKNMRSRVNLLFENRKENSKFTEMTNREYLKWRLETIKTIKNEKQLISVKKITKINWINYCIVSWRVLVFCI